MTRLSPGLSLDAIASVLQAIGALRNRRALAALLGCLATGVLVAGLSSQLGGPGMLLGALILFIASATGVNGAGVLLMDQARGVPMRSLVDALVHGLLCLPKLIVLGLGLLLVEAVVVIVVALVFMICKIPFLGPLLYVAAFPLAVVALGLTVLGLTVCAMLALPAIWQGLGIVPALAQTFAVARARLVEALLLLAIVGFLSLAVGIVVFTILAAGVVPALGLSASILGGGGAGMLGAFMEAGQAPTLGAYAAAGTIGGGLLWALAVTLVGQVWLMGLAIVYLRLTEGLDVGEAQAALLRGIEDAKRRAGEFGERARAAAVRARDATTASAPVLPPRSEPLADAVESTLPAHAAVASATAMASAVHRATPAPFNAVAPPYSPPPVARASTPMACPACAAPCTADDLFCGVCGHRLR